MNTTSTTVVPQAFIASAQRNRFKVYDGKQVYLKGGNEFEIELYNPTQDTIAAKIHINGKCISQSMIVLKPGERTFLQRYLDTNKKFKFDTYTVEDSSETKKAIENNGIVRIEFFKERIVSYNGTTIIQYPPYYSPYWGSTGGYVFNSQTGTINVNTAGTNSSNAFYCNTSSVDGKAYSSDELSFTSFASESLSDSVENSKSIETGRIEAGSASNQYFNNYYGSFESWHFASVEYKLLPESTKPIEANKIRNYCSGCGNRIRKSSWKFCPNCSTKLD